jgi:radical SAM-linked protein
MRIRFRFTKLGRIRFTSQRDVARMWERALRRAGLPLAYTEGFSPRPQLSFGLALPTGCESLAEYLDVVVDDDRPETAGLTVDDLPARLSPLLPAGLEVEEAALVERAHGSLQQQVTSCSWTIEIGGLTAGQLEDRVAALLAAPSVDIERERKGRQERDDLRPSVLALAVATGVTGETPGRLGLVAELATQPRGVRPIELVRGLIAVADGPEDQSVGTPALGRACRTQQWIDRDGDRTEPLPRRGRSAATDRTTHLVECAS